MSWTFCTSGAALIKAGLHASALITNYANAVIKIALDELSDEAEGFICTSTNVDWVASYAGLKAPIQKALSDIASSKIAMAMIQYDPTGYLTREADMLMNYNSDIISRGLKFLDGKTNVLKTP